MKSLAYLGLMSYYLCDFGPEKGPLCAHLLCLVLLWLPYPKVMACSLLSRNPMRLINYFTSPNLSQNQILQESIVLLIFRPCHFRPFDKVSSRSLK
jgi:hypothetical protein